MAAEIAGLLNNGIKTVSMHTINIVQDGEHIVTMQYTYKTSTIIIT